MLNWFESNQFDNWIETNLLNTIPGSINSVWLTANKTNETTDFMQIK